ncbi:MAG TPA: DNA repair protein RecO [Acidimicrobiales bacterium]|nr:DNA repair protein RecO [Acidimicrobiales bacterium]
MSLYRDRGVVLRTYKLGEADRIVVFLSAGHGKVRAVAKGVRRTKSRLGGRLEPLSHVELLMYEGRELDIVTQAEMIEPWRPLREDLGRLAQGLAMAEATEQVAQEREPSEPLYRMLAGALRTLCSHSGPLVVAAFYWKLLSLDGAGPVLSCCASCGSGPPDVPLVAFDMAEGGALCRGCRRGLPLSPAALELLGWILGGQLARALEMPASATTGEVTHLATVSLEAHLERRLRTLHVLEATY